MAILDLNHKTPAAIAAAAAPDFFSTQVAGSRRFYFDLSPPPAALTVVCGGLEYCTPDYVIHRQNFAFYNLEYVVRGRGALRFGDAEYGLESGSVFAYGPQHPHDIATMPDEPLVKYFVSFLGDQADEMLQACALGLGGKLQVFPAQALALLFEETIQCGLTGGPFGVEMCNRLLRCLLLKVQAAAAPADSRETAAFATYRRCRKHIERHFQRLKSLTEIAGECHIAQAYLCRLFRRYEHVSPYQFLLRLKMHYAAERLREPGMLVKQAAETVGFTDTLHFSRVFRRVLGIPPSDFRGGN